MSYQNYGQCIYQLSIYVFVRIQNGYIHMTKLNKSKSIYKLILKQILMDNFVQQLISQIHQILLQKSNWKFFNKQNIIFYNIWSIQKFGPLQMTIEFMID
ncbi:unnamed protein product [Paramecium primaurelia]|uniref:Uncharacterized protein n=1 Tax=Paramecium primaurelia TaxID=5886 RepID=A0A8S1QLR2_PARPR|nr:unnamed protein product [Paramecium primaurelia]